MAIRDRRLPAKISNRVMLAAPDIDVDLFDNNIADLGVPRPRFTLLPLGMTARSGYPAGFGEATRGSPALTQGPSRTSPSSQRMTCGDPNKE